MFGLDVGAAVLARFLARKENHTSRLLRVAFKHEVTPGDSPRSFVRNRPIPSVWLIGSASQLLHCCRHCRTPFARTTWRGDTEGPRENDCCKRMLLSRLGLVEAAGGIEPNSLTRIS